MNCVLIEGVTPFNMKISHPPFLLQCYLFPSNFAILCSTLNIQCLLYIQPAGQSPTPILKSIIVLVPSRVNIISLPSKHNPLFSASGTYGNCFNEFIIGIKFSVSRSEERRVGKE